MPELYEIPAHTRKTNSRIDGRESREFTRPIARLAAPSPSQSDISYGSIRVCSFAALV